MAKSKFFRIAVEGATTDGRKIERNWIEQMAAGYNTATYTARINCEHLRGFSPEAPFNAYGSVVALKTEEVDLEVNGKTEKRLALTAQIDANEQLVALNRKGQKLFTSIEVSPDFAGTGKAGLVGLAVTDSPASLGTEMLEFAAGQGDKNPLAARKQDKANLFTAAAEASIEIEDDGGAGLLASIRAMFNDGLAKFAPGKSEPEPEKKPDAPAGFDVAAYSAAIGEQIAAVAVKVDQSAAIVALTARVDALATQLAKTEDKRFTRAPATGGNGGDVVATDC